MMMTFLSNINKIRLLIQAVIKTKNKMTPKEKAKDLVFEFCNIDSDSGMYDNFKMPNFYAQRCALIAVDKIIKSHTYGLSTELKTYWQEVKKEIEKL